MGTVKIGRYSDPTLAAEYSGWIEPDDKSWIIFLDGDGKPLVYYAEREPDGAVVGDGVWFGPRP